MKEKNQTIQWAYDLVKNTYLNKSEQVKWQDELYLNYLHPFAKEFYSPKNSLMLFGGHSFYNIKEKSQITARDGLIPLSIFFREIEPSDLDYDLFIHKDLWFIVPVEWRTKVKFYEIKAESIYSSKKLPQKIFVSGLLNSAFSDSDEFESSLKNLSDIIASKNLENIEVMAYFPGKRNDLWGSWEEENILKYSAAIFKNLKMDIKTPSWAKIKAETDFKNCLYYEVNSGLFVKDSFLSHFVLSRGGGLLEQDKDELDNRFTLLSRIKASLYHSYYFYEFNYDSETPYVDPLSSPHAAKFKKIIEFGNKDLRLNFEWEKWYASYIKKFYKLRKKGNNSLFNL